LAAETYNLGSDSQPQPGVPKGTITKYQLAPGKLYPGTPHNYSVYVPAQYNPAKPAPFMIYLDGSGAVTGMHVPVVFDNLIARGELPPLIGIFIDPGVLPAASEAAQSRFERVFEYDSINDRFVRFLITELIPEIGKKYNLSKDPNDHGISGNSTGAVGAFMAAWERPDQFRRVLSFIGTFVAMKGADSLPAMIRKTEPKPIRIFMQEGRNDHIVPGLSYGTFYAGSWPINNQVMFEALSYSGYDVKFVMGDEGHNSKHGAAIMPDALRWLWRGYPEPIAVHPPAAMNSPGWDPRGKVYSVVSADQLWQQVGETYSSVRGPAPDKDGNVFFADAADGRIYRADSAGKAAVFKENAGKVAALRIGADGRLYVAEPDRKRIVSFGTGGDEKMVAQNVEAADLALTAKGDLYYTEPAQRRIGYVSAAGKRRVVYDGGEIGRPTGLSLSPDQAMLVVTDAQYRFSWSFQLAADGSLVNGEPFYRLEIPDTAWMSGVAGVTLDSIGQVYFATALGVQMCEANGRVAAILNRPEIDAVSGVAFGGPEMNWLYVAAGGKLFRRPTKTTGVGVWNVAKLPKPPL
jgi:sugar lactone lactonase YvrE